MHFYRNAIRLRSLSPIAYIARRDELIIMKGGWDLVFSLEWVHS